MTIHKTTLFALALSVGSVLSGASSACAAILETFDNPVNISDPLAPGYWRPDRQAPAGFESQVDFDGDNRLRLSIDAADANSDGFRNTQGRKLDLTSAPYAVNSISVDLYIDSEWENTNRRLAALWGAAFDAGGANPTYPIIEFTTGAAGYESTVNDPSTAGAADPRFRVWDSATGWHDIGLPTDFAYDEWQTLSITLANGEWIYQVGDLTFSADAGAAAYIGDAMLQGYNLHSDFGDGVTYDIYWDNFAASMVPEPSTYALSLGALAAIGVCVWRRKRAQR